MFSPVFVMVPHACPRPCLIGPPAPIHQAVHPSSEKIQWIPPPQGFVKVNSDASVRNDGRAGYGGLVRNARGEWIVGFCGFLGNDFELGIKSVVQAELNGILVGLTVARTRGWSNVIIESDCKVAIDMINGNNVVRDERGKIIQRCKELLDMGGCYVIRHQKREGNFCADKLAKIGVEGEVPNLIFPTIPPPHIVPFLIADQLGVGYERGTRL